MILHRRTALLCGAASLASACLPVAATRDRGAPALGPEVSPAAQSRLRRLGRGLPGAGAAPRASPTSRSHAGSRDRASCPALVDRDRNQTEFRRTTEDYLALVASEDDIALGRSRVRPVRPVLVDIERATGVDADVLAAIWGVETRFGTRLGEIPVISATSTLAWEGTAGTFLRGAASGGPQDRADGRHDARPDDRVMGGCDGPHGS